MGRIVRGLHYNSGSMAGVRSVRRQFTGEATSVYDHVISVVCPSRNMLTRRPRLSLQSQGQNRDCRSVCSAGLMLVLKATTSRKTDKAEADHRGGHTSLIAFQCETASSGFIWTETGFARTSSPVHYNVNLNPICTLYPILIARANSPVQGEIQPGFQLLLEGGRGALTVHVATHAPRTAGLPELRLRQAPETLRLDRAVVRLCRPHHQSHDRIQMGSVLIPYA